MYNNYNGNRKASFQKSNGNGFARAPYAPKQDAYNNHNTYQTGSSGNVKKSGAKSGAYRTKDGEMVQWVSGYKRSRNQPFLTIICSPYKDTNTSESKNGLKYQNWIAKIKSGYAEPYIRPCLYHMATGKVVIDDLSLVINPKAPNGGYCGTFIKS